MDFSLFRNRKVFVTGGTGFFGKSIFDLLARGFLSDTQFVVLSRDPQRFSSEYPQFSALDNVRFVPGDVRDFEFPDEKFDFIIHAATPAVTTLAPGEMRSIILGGMHRVLDFARKCQAERLLFTSSGAVYGIQEPECLNIDEEHPCHPLTEYGIAKLEAENLCRYSCVDVLVARCFAFTGPHLNRDIHFAIGNFMRDALEGKDIIIKGDGTPLRSYLYADDLVEWLFTILAHGEPHRPYNVGSPSAVSIAELARLVASRINPGSQVKIMGTPVPGIPASRYVPDISRAQKELQLEVKVSLEEAIDRSIR